MADTPPAAEHTAAVGDPADDLPMTKLQALQMGDAHHAAGKDNADRAVEYYKYAATAPADDTSDASDSESSPDADGGEGTRALPVVRSVQSTHAAGIAKTANALRVQR